MSACVNEQTLLVSIVFSLASERANLWSKESQRRDTAIDADVQERLQTRRRQRVDLESNTLPTRSPIHNQRVVSSLGRHPGRPIAHEHDGRTQ